MGSLRKCGRKTHFSGNGSKGKRMWFPIINNFVRKKSREIALRDVQTDFKDFAILVKKVYKGRCYWYRGIRMQKIICAVVLLDTL